MLLRRSYWVFRDQPASNANRARAHDRGGSKLPGVPTLRDGRDANNSLKPRERSSPVPAVVSRQIAY